MRKFLDTENGVEITIAELEAEFEQLKREQPTEYNYSFDEYLNNCTSKNGFLCELLPIVVLYH